MVDIIVTTLILDNMKTILFINNSFMGSSLCLTQDLPITVMDGPRV